MLYIDFIRAYFQTGQNPERGGGLAEYVLVVLAVTIVGLAVTGTLGLVITAAADAITLQ